MAYNTVSVRFKAKVIDLLFIVCEGSIFGTCNAAWCLQCPLQVGNHLDAEKRDVCFTLTVFLMSLDC